MYTILISESNELITTNKERIMRRSKLVDKLQFLTPVEYKGYDMRLFTATLEYRLPVTGDYKTETLIAADELYKDHIVYTLPIDTTMTTEPGDVEISITFTAVDMDTDGNIRQYVRKTGPGTVTIIPVQTWSDMIPSADLSALDQRLIKQDAQMQQLLDMQEQMAATQATDLMLTEDLLQLQTNGSAIGQGVKILVVNPGDSLDGTEDGVLNLDELDVSNSEDEEITTEDGSEYPGFIEL